MNGTGSKQWTESRLDYAQEWSANKLQEWNYPTRKPKGAENEVLRCQICGAEEFKDRSGFSKHVGRHALNQVQLFDSKKADVATLTLIAETINPKRYMS